MALHPDEMTAAIIKNLPTKSGRSLAEWLALLAAHAPFAKPKDAVAWLKGTHGLGHVSALIVVQRAAITTGQSAGEVATEGPFIKATAQQRALFDELAVALQEAVPDTTVTVCKTYVGFGNPVQFATSYPLRDGSVAVGLSGIDSALPEPTGGKPRGGSTRIRWLLLVTDATTLALAVQHAKAAAAPVSRANCAP
jgi:Domain of unknown function (DUF4287)/Domain of unknown function (DUF5655)